MDNKYSISKEVFSIIIYYLTLSYHFLTTDSMDILLPNNLTYILDIFFFSILSSQLNIQSI